MKRLLSVAVLMLGDWAGQTGADDKKPPAPDKQAIAEFLTAYQKTPFPERGKYVTHPKEFEKLQETHYKDRRIADEVQTTVTSAKAGPKADYLTVVARHKITLDGKKGTVVFDYYLVNTKKGLKIDWMATIGYNPVGFKAWAAGTDHTLTVRAEAELSDYYNYHYGDAQDTHYSVKFVENYVNRSDRFHGYVSKDSDLGKNLFEIVKDGQRHKLTVSVERTGRETSVVGIKQLVSETWVK